MADEFLSQEEVDSLLRGVTGESEEAEKPAGDEGSIRSYNLGKQERIVRGRMPTMEIINERFARLFRISLFNLMRRTADVSVGQLRVTKFSEFIRNLPVPTNINLIHANPLRGTALFVFDPNLVFLVVDNMFGSDGRFHSRVEGRDFTPTEQRIIQGLLRVIFSEYEKSWKPVYPLSFEYIRSEMNTQFANIATPSEIVLSVTFTIELSGTSAEMHICLPYSMIEPIRDMLSSSMHSEQLSSDKHWTTMLTRQLQDAEVQLVAALCSSRVTLGQIMEMKIGDVVPVVIEDTITATVDDIPVMECRYGLRNGQYALKVERFVAQDAEQK